MSDIDEIGASPGGEQDARVERLEDSWMTPEGGYETAPGPTVKDGSHIPVPYGRDAQTDCRTMAQVGEGNIMDDRDLDDVGFLSDLNVTSLGEEKRRMGWKPIQTPLGAGPVPRPVNTSGTRGADDIGPVPPDGSLP